jgi:hypothetical protein
MFGGSLIALFYTSIPTSEYYDRTIDTCAAVGFDIENTSEPFPPASGEHKRAEGISFDGWDVTLRFHLDSDRVPKQPALTVGGMTESIAPRGVQSLKIHQERMNTLFELLCRLAIALESSYVAVVQTEGRPNAITPTGRPIAEHVDTPPRIGIYVSKVLDTFGGVAELFDNEPWYVAELTDGRVVVIESPTPWADGGWQPPTSAEFIKHTGVHTKE